MFAIPSAPLIALSIRVRIYGVANNSVKNLESQSLLKWILNILSESNKFSWTFSGTNATDPIKLIDPLARDISTSPAFTWYWVWGLIFSGKALFWFAWKTPLFTQLVFNTPHWSEVAGIFSHSGLLPCSIKLIILFIGATFQCSGTSPNHSTPESFIGTFGSSPLVTAWLITAWRFSFSSSISCCCFSIKWSILVVSWSRKSKIFFCSSNVGKGTYLFFISSQLIAARCSSIPFPKVAKYFWNGVFSKILKANLSKKTSFLACKTIYTGLQIPS